MALAARNGRPARERRELPRGAMWIAVALAAAACGAADNAPGSASRDGWHEFQGSWTAAGTITTLPLGAERQASVADLKGSLVLAGPSRPGLGFRGDVIALADSTTGMVGRAVWTDDKGDRVFSELRGGGPAKGSHVVGTIVGGTGRYAGATGDYEFDWQYVIAAEDGTVQGRAVGLKGRVRAGNPAAAGGSTGGRP